MLFEAVYIRQHSVANKLSNAVDWYTKASLNCNYFDNLIITNIWREQQSKQWKSSAYLLQKITITEDGIPKKLIQLWAKLVHGQLSAVNLSQGKFLCITFTSFVPVKAQ